MTSSESARKSLQLFDLSGRTAFVTGGGRGIGRAIALGLAEAGADVAIASRKRGACEAVAREIEFTSFPKIAGGRLRKGRAMADLETALNVTIPGLMEFLPRGRAPAAVKSLEVAETTVLSTLPPPRAR